MAARKRRLVAVTAVRLDGAILAPGDEFEAAPGVANELLASGSAKEPGPEPTPLTAIDGVDDALAEALQAAGIPDAESLAGLDDASAAELAERDAELGGALPALREAAQAALGR